jgi:hypothetical protein
MEGRSERNEEACDHTLRVDEPAGEGDADEAARYLAAAVADLGLIARRHRLATHGFQLDMAQMEAEDIVRRRAAHERF